MIDMIDERVRGDATPPTMVIESISWKRILLTMEGRLEGSIPDLDDLTCYVRNTKNGRTVEAGRLMIDGARFVLESRIMHLLDGSPLYTGDWEVFLASGKETAERTPALMDANLTLDPSTYGGLFTQGQVRYWVIPSPHSQTGTFTLSVTYKRTPSKKQHGWKRIRSRTRSRMRHARKRAYLGTYHLLRRLTRRNGKRILFTSDSRSEISGNLLHIHDRMIERGLDDEYRLLSIFKPSIKVKRCLLDKIRFVYYVAIADVIILDDYQPMLYVLDFPEDVKIVQVWHAAGAFKTVGYSRIGKPGGPSPFSNTHKIYTHAIVSSEHDIPYYAEAFGVPEANMCPTGIPRTDMFFDQKRLREASDRAHDALPLTRDKRTILFAPTFRGRGPSDAYYDFDMIDLEGLYDLCTEQDSCVVFKFHPFIRQRFDIPERFNDRFVDATDSRELNDILTISDLVITDYSSLIFEFSTLGRPMLFLAYDMEEYEASRDFYEGLTDFAPGKIVHSFSEVLEAIRTQDFDSYKVEKFASQHFAHADSNSCDRVIDEVIL